MRLAQSSLRDAVANLHQVEVLLLCRHTATYSCSLSRTHELRGTNAPSQSSSLNDLSGCCATGTAATSIDQANKLLATVTPRWLEDA